MEILIREMKKEDYPLLADFLYNAVYVPEGAKKPPASITDLPQLQVYIRDFGKSVHDRGLVAVADGRPVGAVWARIMNDYGHIDDETPSLVLSVFREHRGNGIGTALSDEMIARLRAAGYARVSLSVQKANYAVKIYQKAGFLIADENEEEYIMVLRL